MARYSIEDTTLTNIADAIRGKTGGTNSIQVANMATEINGIETGGDMQSKTVTPTTIKQTVTPDSGYDGLSSVVVNAIPSTYVKPTITKTATTYTPTTSNQTIAAGTYCSGIQTIAGDSNLVAENIAEGVSIFGVTGTHSGGSGGASVETCTVTITNQATSIITQRTYVVYSYLENGTISSLFTNGRNYVLENVPRNSILTIYTMSIGYTIETSVTTNATRIYGHSGAATYSVGTDAAGDASITINVA